MTFRPLLSLSVFLSVVSGTLAADWPQWRGPNRNGTAPAVVPLSSSTRFEEAWSAEIGAGFASMAIADGKVIAMGNKDDQDIVWCFDAHTGTSLWKHSYPSPLDPNLFEGGPTATPCIKEGRVVTLGRRGQVYCLSLSDGSVHWSFDVVKEFGWSVPTWGFSGSPLVIDDRVFLNAGSRGLCLNFHDGEVVWKSDDEEEAGYSSPLSVETGDTQLLLQFSGKTFYAVDPATGAVAWSLPWITRYGVNACDPISLGESRAIISSGYGKGTALIEFDADSAELTWRKRELRNQLSPGILLGDFLYAVDGDTNEENHLLCMEATSGEVRWSETGFGSATMICLGENLLVLTDQGELVVIDPQPAGLMVLTRQAVIDGKCWTMPACADGLCYVRNAAGKLICLKIKNE